MDKKEKTMTALWKTANVVQYFVALFFAAFIGFIFTYFLHSRTAGYLVGSALFGTLLLLSVVCMVVCGLLVERDEKEKLNNAEIDKIVFGNTFFYSLDKKGQIKDITNKDITKLDKYMKNNMYRHEDKELEEERER